MNTERFRSRVFSFFDDSIEHLSSSFNVDSKEVTNEAISIFKQRQEEIYRRTDVLFAKLLFAEWLFAIFCSLVISPRTWSGAYSQTHFHVWVAIFLGGAVVSLPIYRGFKLQGSTVTRHSIAFSQILMSALLIHLTGGRIETHFHVFGSLAFLAFYRDWRVLITATVTTAVDHLFRGIYWPESAYGVLTPSKWRWLEHSAWVIFEVSFLIRSCIQSRSDMLDACFKQAKMKEALRVLGNTTNELTKSQEQYSAIFRTAADGIITIDEDGTIVSVNDAAISIFGYESGELDGKNIRILVPPLYDGENHSPLLDLIENEISSTLNTARELKGKKKNEEIFDLELSISEIRGNDQHIFTGIVRDISKRKEVEEQLKIAKESAENTSRAKGQFLANMSHEIRTPLNGIIGMVDILKSSRLSLEQMEQIDTISQSGEHLLSVINDILDFSKIETGNLTIENSKFDLISCIESTCEIMAPNIDRKHLEFPIFIGLDVPSYVESDEARLRQVLINLLGNATKYTPTGHVSLKVDVVSDLDSLVSVCFEISDTGVGIPEAHLNKIFEAFQQTDDSDTRKYGGTGLGLSITKTIVEAMNGSLEVESQESKGSIFRVTIPLQTGEAQSPQLIKGKIKHPIIVASSSSTYRKYVCKYVESFGGECYETKTYRDTIDFTEVLPHDNPGVVVIDRSLVEKNLSDFLDNIKTTETLNGWFFIVTTNYSDKHLADLSQIQEMAFIGRHPIKRKNFLSLIINKKIESSQLDDTAANYKISTQSSLRILVVEDNPTNQKVAKLMIKAAGHQLEVANHGAEAVEKFSSDRGFDLILMDCQMPIMDGYEATRKIREIERDGDLTRTPIVAMTANAFKQTKEECFECGMNGFVTKPIKTHELIDAIDSTMDQLRRAA